MYLLFLQKKAMKKKILYSVLAIVLLGFFSVAFLTCSEDEGVAIPAISIENVAGPRQGICGEFFWQVRFKLAVASPLGGWLVQKITINRQATVNCPTVYAPINVTYWEAWQVNAGKDVSIYVEANANDFDDQYSWPSWPNSEGFHNNDGELRYYENLALPADFVAKNPRTYAGDLPSTDTPPAFWGAGASEAHNLHTDWDCCDTSIQHLTTVPAFSGKPGRTITPKGGPFFEWVETLKAWTDSTGYTYYDNQHLIQNATALSQLTDAEILQGVTQYASYYAGCIPSMSKLFLILRVIYNVPNSIPMAMGRSYGSWIRPQADLTAATYNPLWPLDWDSFPAPVVLHAYMGYLGAPYNAVGEAQYFIESFGRRTF